VILHPPRLPNLVRHSIDGTVPIDVTRRGRRAMTEGVKTIAWVKDADGKVIGLLQPA
jgi:hypothetical protein